MQDAQPSLLTRDDTLFGVCEALGEDFGFNANYLRLALATSLIWTPAVALIAYPALGVIVALSRWIYPSRPKAAQQPAAEAAPLAAQNDAHAEELALAA